MAIYIYDPKAQGDERDIGQVLGPANEFGMARVRWFRAGATYLEELSQFQELPGWAGDTLAGLVMTL